MRKGMFVVFSLLFAGAYIAPVVMADEAAAPKAAAPKSEAAARPAATAKKGKMTTVKGEVTSVDAAGNTVKIKEGDKEVTLNVTDKTAITSGKTKKSLADLQAGDKVVAKMTEEDGKMTARSIRVATGAKAKKEAAPKAEAPKMEAPKTQEAPAAK